MQAIHSTKISVTCLKHSISFGHCVYSQTTVKTKGNKQRVFARVTRSHNETKGGICIKIEFNPQKNISLLQHDRHFFVYSSTMAVNTLYKRKEVRKKRPYNLPRLCHIWIISKPMTTLISPYLSDEDKKKQLANVQNCLLNYMTGLHRFHPPPGSSIRGRRQLQHLS